MSEIIKSEEEIVADIKNTIEFYLSKANSLKAMLDARIKSTNGSSTERAPIISPPAASKTKRKYTKHSESKPKAKKWKKVKFLFGGVIIDILKAADKPMLTRTLMEEFQALTGKNYERKNFSSMLSIEQTTKKTIKNYKFENNPNDSKFWWGLNDWFAPDGTFKQQYQDKIKTHIVT